MARNPAHILTPLSHLLRGALVLCLLVGLMLPKVSSALVSIVPGWTSAVICTGDQVVIVTVAEDGQPVELDHPSQQDCVRAGSVPTSGDVAWAIVMVDLPPSGDFRIKTNALADLPLRHSQALKQAPPAGA